MTRTLTLPVRLLGFTLLLAALSLLAPAAHAVLPSALYGRTVVRSVEAPAARVFDAIREVLQARRSTILVAERRAGLITFSGRGSPLFYNVLVRPEGKARTMIFVFPRYADAGTLLAGDADATFLAGIRADIEKKLGIGDRR